MIKKILIANRGEIACRIMTTCQRLGIKTVAVYSDADANSKHASLADEAIHIGPPAVNESYLKSERLIEAALRTGAQAIHPGYGFLSENPEFVEAVEAAGLTFIGPPASAIRAMGLKDAAKALMVKAGVPVVPGYHGERQDVDFLAAEAEKIGYPVLIKARAGGGGKGMRLVEEPGSFKAALEGAQREGLASFGDPACLIEKFVTQPRHIEIQVFGDGHGNAIYLFERDCSLQRRHQKVIEEAPAPGMSQKVREAMGKAAVEAAKAIGYEGAGTVEFIADGSGALSEDGFWFMEMNTRLQVEHPVSEAITGLDFVEMQIRVAQGEALPVQQEDLKIDGWSFEARVYAEDVPKGFLPATGKLDYLAFPAGSAFSKGSVRIDSGVRQGDEISPYYDPMIAKVIVHGPTRTAALNLLTASLDQCHIAGLVTNLEFLSALSRHEGFAKGEVDTGLIGRDIDHLIENTKPPQSVFALAAISALGLLKTARTDDPWDSLAGWRHWTEARHFVGLEKDGERYEFRVITLGRHRYQVEMDGSLTEVTISKAGHTAYHVTVDDVRFNAFVVQENSTVCVFLNGRSFVFNLPDFLAGSESDQAEGDTIIAPMPGLVKLVSAKSGDRVSKGDALLILEAMKMENTLTAPRDGVVAEILASEGDQVTNGTLLLALEPEDG